MSLYFDLAATTLRRRVQVHKKKSRDQFLTIKK